MDKDINKDWFTCKINNFLENDERNKLRGFDCSYIFKPDVLVGIADGNDPIYTRYKKIIGEFHITPSEAYEWYCKKNNFEFNNENLSVVAYILPINKDTKIQNYNHSKTMPSERWAYTRQFGEQANESIQKYLVDELKKFGINAFAPILDKNLFHINREILASNWSHRHNCFAAGLGSFGLSDGFINSRGKAMRCGSFIIDIKLPTDSSNRPLNPYEFCSNCGDCISRCPVNAISFENRHNKVICNQYLRSISPFIKENYGIDIHGCGLCQVGVSCSDGIPNK